MDHRNIGYSLLSGHGIEIGALHNPANLPDCCRVSYCDAMSADDARRSFPELSALPLVNVTHIVDLDKQGLTGFDDTSQDFVILNHVIEHVANPIRVISDCFRVLKEGGKLVMSAPDMRFTFDRNRTLTTPEHLWDEFRQGITRVSDDHYVEFLQAVHPEVVADPHVFAGALISVRDRREHAHVWNSDSFKALLDDVVNEFSIPTQLLLESTGDTNQCEYFSVWQKTSAAVALTLFNSQHAVGAARYLQSHVAAMVRSASDLQDQLHRATAHHQAQADQLAQQFAHQLAEQQVAHQAAVAAQAQALATCQVSLDDARAAHARQADTDERVIADKDRHIRNIESQLQSLTGQLCQMQQSRSWRLTAPLRALSNRFQSQR